MLIENELKKNERSFETLENLFNKTKRNLIKTFTDPSDGMVADDVVTVNDWINKTDEKKPQLDQHQGYDEIACKMIRESNADLVPQMVSNNEIRDWLILEKNTAQKENERKQLEEQTKLDLSVYLRDENYENTTLKRRSKCIAKSKKKKPC